MKRVSFLQCCISASLIGFMGNRAWRAGEDGFARLAVLKAAADKVADPKAFFTPDEFREAYRYYHDPVAHIGRKMTREQIADKLLQDVVHSERSPENFLSALNSFAAVAGKLAKKENQQTIASRIENITDPQIKETATKQLQILSGQARINHSIGHQHGHSH